MRKTLAFGHVAVNGYHRNATVDSVIDKRRDRIVLPTDDHNAGNPAFDRVPKGLQVNLKVSVIGTGNGYLDLELLGNTPQDRVCVTDEYRMVCYL